MGILVLLFNCVVTKELLQNEDPLNQNIQLFSIDLCSGDFTNNPESRVINEKKLDFENYFTLHYPKYFDANSTKDQPYELLHNVPSDFLWWLNIKDENYLKEQIKKQKIIKTQFSYSVFFKYSMAKIASCNNISLHLNFENLKSEYYKKISRPKSEEIKSIHDYTEINNFSELMNKKMISESELKDYGFHNTKNISWENLEFREDVDLNIIIYNDINNQLTIKIMNTRTPTTVTNAPFLKFIKEIPNKEKILPANDQKLSYYSEFLQKSPLLQTDDTLFTELYLPPKHFNISIFEERKISEYLTLFDYDYYLHGSLDLKFEFKKDYYIFQPIRLKKIHYFATPDFFNNEFEEFVYRLKFNEQDYIDLLKNENIKNDPIAVSINFWEKFLEENIKIINDKERFAILIYIEKIKTDNSYVNIYNNIFRDRNSIEDESKKKNISRNLQLFFDYAKKLDFSQYVIFDLKDNKKNHNITRNINRPKYADGSGDEGIS